jgi:hypothetical protein
MQHYFWQGSAPYQAAMHLLVMCPLPGDSRRGMMTPVEMLKPKTNKHATIDWLLSQSSVQSASISCSASVAPSELSNGGDDSGPEKKHCTAKIT